jgi:hypothetical protein
MTNPDHISESLETIFLGLKYLNSLMQIRDPESGMEKIRIRDKHPGSATLLLTQIYPYNENDNAISVSKGHSSLTKNDGKGNRKKTVTETSIKALEKGRGKEHVKIAVPQRESYL